ncbi:MAG: hypothetical protein A3G17_08350 [Planctomycetes bacterium RIFCSPLOWO2_12_FULL_50_35]|nr:MAG: hypothetical protein A3I59_02900 [Planctomycetes bacterium RIFCSPLOWO2_02_FULL_50_16]OHC02736.1 MAG: hypothetical protein A3G17_08350 [Planctomycetes bacterium RIFCSPLOWO2_12_FULL_50_35]
MFRLVLEYLLDGMRKKFTRKQLSPCNIIVEDRGVEPLTDGFKAGADLLGWCCREMLSLES